MIQRIVVPDKFFDSTWEVISILLALSTLPCSVTSWTNSPRATRYIIGRPFSAVDQLNFGNSDQPMAGTASTTTNAKTRPR